MKLLFYDGFILCIRIVAVVISNISNDGSMVFNEDSTTLIGS